MFIGLLTSLYSSAGLPDTVTSLNCMFQGEAGFAVYHGAGECDCLGKDNCAGNNNTTANKSVLILYANACKNNMRRYFMEAGCFLCCSVKNNINVPTASSGNNHFAYTTIF